MRTATISELKNKLSSYLRLVRAGESVLVLDRDKPVARLEPLRGHEAEDERLARLEAAGVIRRPTNPLSHRELMELLSKPRPRSKKSVLKALLEERDEERDEGRR